ncbi:hypothetical protein Tco_0627001 [Tanacetum coccineum]|uniref:Uncharacterized protein n=1 Tax=Tanacetum coccineum TaxID=301880 RepID=A0ABQ4WLA1_9ASTR
MLGDDVERLEDDLSKLETSMEMWRVFVVPWLNLVPNEVMWPLGSQMEIVMGDSTGISVSLGGEIFLGGKKSQESNIGGGTIAGRAIITWGGGITLLISELEGTIVE